MSNASYGITTSDTLRGIIRDLELNPLFVTLTGVHLYGFPSADSDYDLRGAWVLPLRSIIGLQKPDETITRLSMERGLLVDIVLHDIGKYMQLMANANGSILEEVFSPHVLLGEEVAAQMRELAQGCLVRRLYYHYNGFARNQIAKFWSQEPKRVKTLLYIYRILMTGIRVLETGVIESHLPTLNQTFALPFIPRLIAAKVEELSPIEGEDWELHQRTIGQLQSRLRRAYRHSPLPNQPRNLPEIEAYLVQLRLTHGCTACDV